MVFIHWNNGYSLRGQAVLWDLLSSLWLIKLTGNIMTKLLRLCWTLGASVPAPWGAAAPINGPETSSRSKFVWQSSKFAFSGLHLRIHFQVTQKIVYCLKIEGYKMRPECARLGEGCFSKSRNSASGRLKNFLLSFCCPIFIWSTIYNIVGFS